MEAKVRPGSHFSTQFYANQTAEWTSKYCDYSGLEQAISHFGKKKDENSALVGAQGTSLNENQLISRIQHEMDKVGEFYNLKVDEYTVRYQKLVVLAHSLNDSTIPFQEQDENDASAISLSLSILTFICCRSSSNPLFKAFQICPRMKKIKANKKNF